MERWKAGAAPFRREAGFETHGAWAAGDEFVWLPSFDGNFLSADTACYASAARQQMKPDPAELIDASDERMVERVIRVPRSPSELDQFVRHDLQRSSRLDAADVGSACRFAKVAVVVKGGQPHSGCRD